MKIVGSNVGMMLTRESRSTWIKICISASLYTTNLMWTDPGWNPGLHSQRAVSYRLSHRIAVGLKFV